MFSYHSQSTPQRGYSMVEVLVAISVLLLATVGPMTIAARSLQYAQFTIQQNTAFFLAQEGIEAIYKTRANQGLLHFDDPGANDSWGWANNVSVAHCRNGGCGIDWTDSNITNDVKNCRTDTTPCRIYYDAEATGRVSYSHDANGTATPFTRVITFEDAGGDSVRLRSTVSWVASGSGVERSVVLETYLHDIYDTNSN